VVAAPSKNKRERRLQLPQAPITRLPLVAAVMAQLH